jgi:hypothetical protein
MVIVGLCGGFLMLYFEYYALNQVQTDMVDVSKNFSYFVRGLS